MACFSDGECFGFGNVYSARLRARMRPQVAGLTRIPIRLNRLWMRHTPRPSFFCNVRTRRSVVSVTLRPLGRRARDLWGIPTTPSSTHRFNVRHTVLRWICKYSAMLVAV